MKCPGQSAVCGRDKASARVTALQGNGESVMVAQRNGNVLQFDLSKELPEASVIVDQPYAISGLALSHCSCLCAVVLPTAAAAPTPHTIAGTSQIGALGRFQ